MSQDTKSIVRRYFTKSDTLTSKWKCKCGKELIQRKNTGWTNLFNHIKAQHPDFENFVKTTSYNSDMSETSNEFHLAWGLHLPCLLEEFSHLLDSNAHTDLTLVCCDGSLHAHKVIISTCSPFLRGLLVESENCSSSFNTCIFLPDIKIQCMRDLLTYIYKGEISIQGDKIDELVNLASLLQIRGIAVKESTPSLSSADFCNTVLQTSDLVSGRALSEWSHTASDSQMASPLWRDFGNHLPAVETPQPSKTEQIHDEDFFATHLRVKPQHDKRTGSSSSHSSASESVDSKQCLFCKQQFAGADAFQQLRLHIMRAHGINKTARQFICEYCGATFSRAAHMKRHVRTHTGEKPFRCPHCRCAFSRQDKLKAHADKYHPSLSHLIRNDEQASVTPVDTQLRRSQAEGCCVEDCQPIRSTSTHLPYLQTILNSVQVLRRPSKRKSTPAAATSAT